MNPTRLLPKPPDRPSDTRRERSKTSCVVPVNNENCGINRASRQLPSQAQNGTHCDLESEISSRTGIGCTNLSFALSERGWIKHHALKALRDGKQEQRAGEEQVERQEQAHEV